MNSNKIKRSIKNCYWLFQPINLLLRLPSLPQKAFRILQEDKNCINIIGYRNTIKLVLYKVLSLLVFDKTRHKLIERKHLLISEFLRDRYKIIPPNNIPIFANNKYKQCIWVCWLQGEDAAPDLVKMCLRQIRKHSKGHPIHVIDSTNYMKYVDVPENIVNKYRCGKMLSAHFSDYIRYQLLYRYGGVWLDATLFVTQDIGRDGEFDYCLYSAHYKIPQDDNCIAHSRWVTPLFFSKEGNGFMYNTYKLFEQYHIQYQHCIDYLLIDYIMDYIVSENKEYAHMINSIPYNNEDFQLIYRLYTKPYDNEIFKKIMKSKTYFYKLTYKNVPDYYKNGKLTTYGYIMQNF